jgi:hypothetical protein
MLDDITNDTLASLENCTLNELISILQNYACDPTTNVKQAGFGSYITNHVIKEKLERYHEESMVLANLRDVW